jgi:hypothetical protein
MISAQVNHAGGRIFLLLKEINARPQLIIGFQFFLLLVALICIPIWAKIVHGYPRAYPPPPLPKSVTERTASDIQQFEQSLKALREQGTAPAPLPN